MLNGTHGIEAARRIAPGLARQAGGSGGFGGGGGAGAAELIRVILQAMDEAQRSEMARFNAATRRQRKEGRFGVEGLEPHQAPMINSGRTPWDRGQMLATATGARMNRSLQAAGLDPTAGYIRRANPGETEEEYTAAMRTAKQAHEDNRAAIAGRLKAADAKKRSEMAAAGRGPGGGYIVREQGAESREQGTGNREQGRRRDAVAAARGGPVRSEQQFRDAQSFISNPTATPQTERPAPTYTASVYSGSGQRTPMGSFKTADEASTAARSRWGADQESEQAKKLIEMLLAASLTRA